MDKTAGIVLAGGRSSRMGTSKALLRYKDRPLIEHMQNLLHQAGLDDVYISGPSFRRRPRRLARAAGCGASLVVGENYGHQCV